VLAVLAYEPPQAVGISIRRAELGGDDEQPGLSQPQARGMCHLTEIGLSLVALDGAGQEPRQVE